MMTIHYQCILNFFISNYQSYKVADSPLPHPRYVSNLLGDKNPKESQKTKFKKVFHFMFIKFFILKLT